MSRYSSIVLTAACAAAALILVGLFPAVTHSAPREESLEGRVAHLERQMASRPVMAVVDLEELVNDFKKTAELKKRRADYIKRETGKLETVRAAINEMKQKQDKSPKNSEQWWAEEFKIVPRERELEVRMRQFEENIKRMQMEDLEAVYRGVVSAIMRCADREGINVVFWRHGNIDEETWRLARQEGNLMSHRYMIDVRPILYADEDVIDITEDVKRLLPAE